jgi:hypothetical protein
MKRALILILTVLIAYSSSSSAHGPSRKKVIITKDIAATPEQVWQVIGNFQDMSWHPAVVMTEGKGGSEPGATRILVLGNGGKIHEKLEKHNGEKHSLFYRISEVDVKVLPVTNYSSWINVTATEGGSRVKWKGAFYRGYPNNNPPPELNDKAAVDAVTGVYQSGLDNLKDILEQGQ